MRSKSCDVPTKSITSLFYAIPSHHTSEHGPKPCSPRPHCRCRPWNRRGRASNRRWDTKLEQSRQQTWNMCPSVSHQEDGILHGEGFPSGSHCSSAPWRNGQLASFKTPDAQKWRGSMPITTFAFADCAKNENWTFCLTWVPATTQNDTMVPISDLGTRNNLYEYHLAGFCRRIRLSCLILRYCRCDHY